MSSDRVARLLSQMTREEKAAQLVSLWVMTDPETGDILPYEGTFVASRDNDATVTEEMRHGLGQFTRVLGSAPLTAADGVRFINELQRQLVEDTRLGIPAMVHEECLTGFMALGATTFPSPPNWGSTWDPALLERVGDAIRIQMRSVGAHQGLAPVLDVVRDGRWGRVEECISEDPYLVGTMGVAYIRGLQGEGPDTGVIATAKHFAGHAFSEGGRNLAPVHVGPRELADVFLLPFEMAVKQAGLLSVMNAYHDNDGVPAAASHELLTEILRDRWGFDGIVVADYFSIAYLHVLHGVAATYPEAAARALAAGLDVELPSPDCYGQPLLDAVETGLVSDSDLDRSATRVLTIKERLGLLDNPFVPALDEIDLDPPAHRALALEVAEKSIVLLKNHDGRLPLDPSVGSIAVIGPNADSAAAVLGNYSFANHVAAHFASAPAGVEVRTVLDGIKRLASGTVGYARGCDVVGDDASGIAEAAALAQRCDVAVVVVGDQAGHFGAGTSGEGTDTDDLRLPGLQEQLVEAVVDTGTPTVVVLITGRPYAIASLAERVPALIEAWFPGEEGGTAVARALFGAVNPAGRSPVTFSRSAGQQPFSYNGKALTKVGYARSSTRPVFAFGHGLSYTTFAYDDLVLAPTEVAIDGTVTISCTVINTGARMGDEVVQLYVHDLFASVTRPVQELKGFCRLTLEPGESARVTFSLSVDRLAFTSLDLARIVEPGEVEVMVGASSEDIRLRQRFNVLGDERRVLGEDLALSTPVTWELNQSRPARSAPR